MSELAQSNPPEPSPEVVHSIEEMMERVAASATTSSPLETAIANTLDKDHLTKIIDQHSQREANRHKETADERTNTTTVLLLLVLFVIALAWITLYYGKSEIVVPVFTALIGVAGGFGIGHRAGAKSKE